MQLSQINTIAHGTIVNVHKEKQLVDVKIGYLLRYETSNNIEYKEYPIIQNVPLIMLQGGGAKIKFAVKKGDFCLLLFTQRGSRDFLKQGKEVIPSYAGIRMFDINDGFALVGFNSFSKPNTIPDDGIVLESNNKQNSITINDQGINLKAGNSTIDLDNNKINLKIGNSNITLTSTGIEYITNNLTLSSDNIELNAKTLLRLMCGTANSITIQNGNINITSTKVDVNGSFASNTYTSLYGGGVLYGLFRLNGIKPLRDESGEDIPGTEKQGGLMVYGQMSVRGDFDAAMYNKDEEILDPDETFKKTPGSLLSAIHIETSFTFANIATMNIQISYNEYLLTLQQGIYTGEQIAQEFAQQLVDIANVTYENNQFKFETIGIGPIDGYITECKDITTSTNPTSAMLTTGALMDFNQFKSIINDDFVSFIQYIDTEQVTYEVYSLQSLSSWEEFATKLNELNAQYEQPKFEVSYNGTNLVFKSKKTGTLQSSISELHEAFYVEQVSYLNSGVFTDEEVQNLANLTLGFEFLGKNYYFDVPEVVSLPILADLITQTTGYKAIVNQNQSLTLVSFDNIDYFNNIAAIPQKDSMLYTGSLMDFSQFIKIAAYYQISFVFANQTINMDIDNFADYNEVARNITAQMNAAECVYDPVLNILKFTSFLGDATYLSKAANNNIDGSLVFFGTQELGASIIPSERPVPVEENSADLLKMSQTSGATTKTYQENENLNVPYLLKGTKLVGATIEQAKDSEKIIISNLATRLKLTTKTGAIVKPGSETINIDDLGVPYDGNMKIKGNLHVENEIKSGSLTTRELVVEEVSKSNEIQTSKLEVSGETALKNLKVVEESLFNQDCTYNSNIILQNNSKITNNNQTTTIQLNEDAINTSTKIKTTDVEFK